MKRKTVCVILIVISLILAVIEFIVLPDQVVVQIGANGQPSNMLPKPPAIIIPVVISVFGAVRYSTGENEAGKKNLLIVIVGYAVALLSLIVNMI
ncbi:MAG: DUF1648 domain-containing protein [Oscillospiraceae bacterium]